MADTPGLRGIAAIAVATGVAGVAWIAFGAWLPAAACGAAIVAGLIAVQAINKP